jgi:hypothetical protein
LEEYRTLHQGAIALKKEAPWEWMQEDEIFGILNPETNQIGYVSIMGALGEHLALGLYLGSEGLHGFWKMSLGEGGDNPTLALEIPHLQASFEDRNTLSAKDREVIKTLGLKFRGRQAWPMFRSIVPGCLPWFVTSEETRFLSLALEQAMDVIPRLSEEPDLLEPDLEDQYLVRVQTEEGWVDEWLTAEPFRTGPPPPVDAQRVAEMRRTLRREEFALEADLFALHTQIIEKGDPRPYLPYTLLVVEADSGFILGIELLIAQPSLDAVWQQTTARFLDALTRMGSLPSLIVVRDERLYQLLVPVAASLGIQLRVSRRLPALDEARAAVETRM